MSWPILGWRWDPAFWKEILVSACLPLPWMQPCVPFHPLLPRPFLDQAALLPPRVKAASMNLQDRVLLGRGAFLF